MLAGVKIPLSTAEHGAASTGIARGLSEPSGEFRSARAGRAARRVSAAIADDSDAGRTFCCLLIFLRADSTGQRNTS